MKLSWSESRRSNMKVTGSKVKVTHVICENISNVAIDRCWWAIVWQWKGGQRGHNTLLYSKLGYTNLFQFPLQLGNLFWADEDVWGWRKGTSWHKQQLRVAHQLSGQPQKRLLVVVVTLGTQIIILRKDTFRVNSDTINNAMETGDGVL